MAGLDASESIDDNQVTERQIAMNISLPDGLHEFVMAQVAKGGYNSPSDYIRELVRADCAQASVEAEVLKGLESGDSTPMTSEEWRELRGRVESARTSRQAT